MTPITTPECNDVLKRQPDMSEEICGDLPIMRTEAYVASFWKPDAEELYHLNRGEPVTLVVFGETHPPLGVGVRHEVSEPVEALVPKIEKDGSVTHIPVNADIAKMIRELATDNEILRQDGERWRAEAQRWRKIVDGGEVVSCAYCGHRYNDGTPTAKADALTAHIKVCDKHPMRRLRAALAGLVGASTRDELTGMRTAVAAMTPPGSERESMIEAINTLIETEPES